MVKSGLAFALMLILVCHVPASTKESGIKVHCYPNAFIGTWRRINGPIEQQITFWPSGDYNDVLYSPGIDASHGNSSSCSGSETFNLVVYYTVDAQYGAMSHPEISRDGSVLTLHRDRVIEANFGRVIRLSAADTLIRYRRIEELPRIDWKSRARDGGYTWDFRHACPPSDDPEYHALIPELVDDTLAWQSIETGPEPYIQLEEDHDGALRWRFGKIDHLTARRFCRPDRYTLIIEQPGPRGVSLPHRYDVFAHGGLIYFNGLQVYDRERASLDVE